MEEKDIMQTTAGLQSTAATPPLTISPAGVEATPAFEMQLYGEPITAMNKLIRMDQPEKDPYAMEAPPLVSGRVKFFIGSKEITELKITPFTNKLIRILNQELAKVNRYREAVKQDTVQISLITLMEKCGCTSFTKASMDKFRLKLKKHLCLLDSLKVEWRDSKGKDYERMSFIRKQGIRKGYVIVQFEQDMANYLNHAYVMNFPQWLYRLNEKNPNLFPLACKLWEHYSNDNNLKKGTANILKVTTLLENCPTIPTYEDVMSKGRQVGQLIITPLLNTINALEDSGEMRIEWCNAKREPLNKTQLDAYAADWSGNYHSFTAGFLHFEFNGTEKQEVARLENAKQRKKRATKKKKQD